MERNCLFCETTIDKRKHGLVKFCSTQCRNKYYYNNKPDKETQDLDTEINLKINQPTQTFINERTEKYLSGYSEQESFNPQDNNERRKYLSDVSRGILDYDVIRHLEENYKTKTELVSCQIRLENALREIDELKIKNIELENELEEENELEGLGSIKLNSVSDVLNFLERFPILQQPIGSLLNHEKFQNYILSIIPEKK
jgi:hypothetical protein